MQKTKSISDTHPHWGLEQDIDVDISGQATNCHVARIPTAEVNSASSAAASRLSNFSLRISLMFARVVPALNKTHANLSEYGTAFSESDFWRKKPTGLIVCSW